MNERFRTFSALLVAAALAAPVAAAAQAPAAPAAPARGPAGPPAPCGPGVTGKNIASDSRCFELRTYTVKGEGPGSIDLLHTRFRDHTNRLFVKHGMTIVGFWQPTNADMANTLIYVLAYKDRAARDASWKAFQSDPEWVKVRTDLNVGVTVQSVFMNSTDYGPMK
ncbi:MAG TPA: NIPSNAP family protein [Vicinamibacterales bacterium]|nr:NIPSNAP family protein [Vicinamibacterales bacterium]